jgi:hypothetical protein
MATKGTRKALTAEDLKNKLAKAKAAIATLEQRAYAGEIEEIVKRSKINESFALIKDKVKGATDIAILAAIGKAVGIKRLSITQTEPKPRAKKSV